MLVGSWFAQAASGALDFPKPVDCRSGDVLVAAWSVDSYRLASPSTTGWTELGQVHTGIAGGNETMLWTGYRVLDGSDVFGTSYHFSVTESTDIQLVVVAFRGARLVQPINPGAVQLSTSALDGGSVNDEAPVLSAPVPSQAFFVFSLPASAVFPSPGGFPRLQASQDIGVYGLPGPLPAGTQSGSPHVVFSTTNPAMAYVGVATLLVRAP